MTRFENIKGYARKARKGGVQDIVGWFKDNARNVRKIWVTEIISKRFQLINV